MGISVEIWFFDNKINKLEDEIDENEEALIRLAVEKYQKTDNSEFGLNSSGGSIEGFVAENCMISLCRNEKFKSLFPGIDQTRFTKANDNEDFSEHTDFWYDHIIRFDNKTPVIEMKNKHHSHENGYLNFSPVIINNIDSFYSRIISVSSYHKNKFIFFGFIGSSILKDKAKSGFGERTYGDKRPLFITLKDMHLNFLSALSEENQHNKEKCHRYEIKNRKLEEEFERKLSFV
jgi:hypothetical protein